MNTSTHPFAGQPADIKLTEEESHFLAALRATHSRMKDVLIAFAAGMAEDFPLDDCEAGVSA